MIIVYHDNNNVTDTVETVSNSPLKISIEGSILSVLFHIAHSYSDDVLVWCHNVQKDNLNLEKIEKEFCEQNKMISYATTNYLPKSIGYVEDTPFVNINKSICYPTWLMSSQLGAIHSRDLLKFYNVVNLYGNFDYELNSIAKNGMPFGLFCYSNPKIVKDISKVQGKASSIKRLFQFVKQHYKFRWVLLLFVNLMIYDRRFPFISFIKTFFYKRRKFGTIINSRKRVNSNERYIEKSVDVIIPTIGRERYLHSVLKDLTLQTQLPQQVIIVEQNPEKNGISMLDYLFSDKWPFKIVHQFTNKMGACSARNEALKLVKADHVFFADDDIRFGKHVLKDALDKMTIFGINALVLSCLQKNENEKTSNLKQWPVFGSGCSVVLSRVLNEIKFDLALEHGFGEDIDFGMQLRNKGVDIIYSPFEQLLHVKAPIGGFRTKFELPWMNDEVAPKPSPTVMYNRLKNTTEKQLLGYKTVLFLKYYKHQEIKNPIKYYRVFKKQWDRSTYWAKKLMSI
jgi:glycosyltransferase involved in cell wall biosynthesis